MIIVYGVLKKNRRSTEVQSSPSRKFPFQQFYDYVYIGLYPMSDRTPEVLAYLSKSASLMITLFQYME